MPEPYPAGDIEIKVKCQECGTAAVQKHALVLMLENNENPNDPVRVIIPEDTDTSHKAIITTVSGENIHTCDTTIAGNDLHVQADTMTIIVTNWAKYKQAANMLRPRQPESEQD